MYVRKWNRRPDILILLRNKTLVFVEKINIFTEKDFNMGDNENINLFALFFKQTPKEMELIEAINSLKNDYQDSDAYKKYVSDLTVLEEALRNERIEKNTSAIKEYSQKRGRNTGKKTNITVQKEPSAEKIDKMIEEFKALSRTEQAMFNQRLRNMEWGEKPYSNPATTESDISDLQDLLVQICIDFVNNRKLKDIEEISFSVDDLQASADEGEWVPSTDSYIRAVGYEITDAAEDNDMRERRIIGEYF